MPRRRFDVDSPLIDERVRRRFPLLAPAGVSARHPLDGMVAVDDDHVGDGALEEGPVVAHHDQGAGPVVEEVLEGPQRVEVEVVGRLVEQQHVGPLGQDEQQLQPAPLAAGQRADRRPLGVAVEPEPLEQGGVLPVGPAGRPGDGVAHPLRRDRASAPTWS